MLIGLTKLKMANSSYEKALASEVQTMPILPKTI